jgi:hypothetical protein
VVESQKRTRASASVGGGRWAGGRRKCVFALRGGGCWPTVKSDVWPGLPCAGHGMRLEVPLSDRNYKIRYLLA